MGIIFDQSAYKHFTEDRLTESMERYIVTVIETGDYPNRSAYIKDLIVRDQRERKLADA